MQFNVIPRTLSLAGVEERGSYQNNFNTTLNNASCYNKNKSFSLVCSENKLYDWNWILYYK